jgi:hypothetical protein
MRADLNTRIQERVAALQGLQAARMYREFAQNCDDPEVRRLAKGFQECEAGLQAIVDGEVSYVE